MGGFWGKTHIHRDTQETRYDILLSYFFSVSLYKFILIKSSLSGLEKDTGILMPLEGSLGERNENRKNTRCLAQWGQGNNIQETGGGGGRAQMLPPIPGREEGKARKTAFSCWYPPACCGGWEH